MTESDGTVTVSDRLASIENKLDLILAQSLHLRLRALEIIVYGGCGLALMGMVGAVITMVLKTA